MDKSIGRIARYAAECVNMSFELFRHFIHSFLLFLFFRWIDPFKWSLQTVRGKEVNHLLFTRVWLIWSLLSVILFILF